MTLNPTRPLAALIALMWLGGCATAPPEAPAPKPPAETSTSAPAEASQATTTGAPALPERLTRVMLASCNDQDKPQDFWGQLQSEQPDLFIYGGDNVYGDIRKKPDGTIEFLDGDMERLAETYQTLGASPEFQEFRANIPILPIWDDHDYGKNDAGADFPFKKEAEALFLDFWEVPADDARRQREGLYRAWMFGEAGERVQIILLDTRTFRGPLKETPRRNAPGMERYVPDPESSATVLGEAQWAWLEAELKKPADVRLLVSTIQVIADGHGWERWGLLPRERQRLYDTIVRSRAAGVVILSGDRHQGALYRITPEGGYPLYELTSSSLNLSFGGGEEAGPHRIGDMFAPENYGLIEFDWAAREIRLRLLDLKGAPVMEQKISMKDLNFKTP
ncbi:MAG: phosphodiesterase [Myxococcales bacterium]|nr:phosphodiesterase [Myxococcales bacterium]